MRAEPDTPPFLTIVWLVVSRLCVIALAAGVVAWPMVLVKISHGNVVLTIFMFVWALLWLATVIALMDRYSEWFGS